jgi:Ran GTPase-activating protein (RanGAP) involved in mRNA processing and transport
MRLADCRFLARALAHTETLVHLDLSSNCLDDDKARMLASGLADNISITHLNLSHNKVGSLRTLLTSKYRSGRDAIRPAIRGFA